MSRFAGVSDAASGEQESTGESRAAAKYLALSLRKANFHPTLCFSCPHRCMESTTYKITKL
jgi:hypothetical protein